MAFPGDLLLTKVCNSCYIASRYLCPGSEWGSPLCPPEPEKRGQEREERGMLLKPLLTGPSGEAAWPDQAEFGPAVLHVRA